SDGSLIVPNATTTGNFTVGTSTFIVQHDPFGTGNDKIGIGTDKPKTKLHIVGASGIVGEAPSPGTVLFIENNSVDVTAINLMSSTTGAGALYFGDDDSDRPGRILYNHAVDRLDFSAGEAQVMALAIDSTTFNDGGNDIDWRVETANDMFALTILGSDGRVGVGDPVPNAKLSVVGNVSANSFSVDSTTSSGGDLLTVKSSGNVGLGLIAPAQTLEVDGNASTTGWLSVGSSLNSAPAYMGIGDGLFGGNVTSTKSLFVGTNLWVNTTTPTAGFDNAIQGDTAYDGVIRFSTAS
ncbi:unnamed protein product, partial [marine sediment metagenome]